MRGGYRPGSGPAKGTKYRPRKGKALTPPVKPKAIRKPKLPLIPPSPVDPDAEKIRQMLSMREKAKQRIFGEFMNRVARGEKLTVAEINKMEKLGAELEQVEGEKMPAPAPGVPLDLEAAEYLRKVWNDPTIDHSLRIRAAEIIAKGDGAAKGVKEKRNDRAKLASGGRFKASAPPILKVVGNEK